ncbi:hypothetical protein [Glaciecola sp. SC05]|uniref:hypothetical protein n=1 Tax=Glaciecola sp. SC05 TaxID=1987355 RepID=UPI003528F2C9
MNIQAKGITATCFAAISVLLAMGANAQQGSDLYIGKLNLLQQEPLSDIVRITDTDAYTNQPYFFDSNHLYFTQSVEQGDATQTDIFEYQLLNSAIINITQSSQSEYSATPLPAGRGMSVIRVNGDGKQQLWSLDMQGQPVQHLASGIEPVGYQVWLSKEELLLFVLGEPHTLQRVNINSKANKGQVIDSDIGASLYQFERSDWYLYSQGQDNPQLKAYNARSQNIITVAPLPKGSVYFSVSATGHVITSSGEGLYHRQLIAKGDRLQAEGDWTTIPISLEACQSGISRTAVSHFGDKLALICPR